MKNLHVLPTENQSRLRYNIITKIWELNEFHKYHTDIKSTHNIYITSEEEIKEGDYVVQINFEKTNTQVIKCETEFQTKIANSKDGSFSKNKIILTTDSYLIKDGVQEINDTFLEWFVKNSSCEFVELKHIIKEYVDDQDAYGYDVNYYKIIIPSEESKQGRTCTNNCSVVCGECQIFDKKPITNLEKLLFPELVAELAGYYKNTQLVEKPKEVVEKTTKMYSEEEVKTIINDIVEKHCTYFRQETKDSVKLEWFKKFKK